MRGVLIFSFCAFLTGGLAQSGGGLTNEELLANLYRLITTGTIEHFAGCTTLPNIPEEDIAYYLYTRDHTDGILLTSENLSELNVTKITKVLVHGFAATATDPLLLDIVEAYISRYDCSVIVIDYKNVTNVIYTQAYCNVIVAADMMADYFCNLHEEGYFDISSSHFIGASLGGQTVGLIGASVQAKCNQKIGRITTLDPAGPIYQNQDISKRVDKSDSTFHDSIHTNMGVIGYYGSVGHVDFFPNCGTLQPGCINLTSALSLDEIILYFPCNHGRSALFFLESIPGTGTVFKSTSCSKCPNSNGNGVCLGRDIFLPKYTIMGEDCPRNPPYNKFYLTTNSIPHMLKDNNYYLCNLYL